MKKGENCLLLMRNDYEVWQNDTEMENDMNLNSEKNILVRISAVEETVRIRSIKICNAENIVIH